MPAKQLMKAAEESEDEEKTPSHCNSHNLHQRKEKYISCGICHL
jgi:hypothetical protein